MNYIRVANSKIIETQLPKTGTLKNGQTVSGYDLLVEDILLAEGWLPFEENKPEYDEDTQYLEFIDYTITEDKIIANYTVKDIEPESEFIDEHLDDELVAMAEAIIDFDERLTALEGI